jgi:hypothetical protein
MLLFMEPLGLPPQLLLLASIMAGASASITAQASILITAGASTLIMAGAS